MSSFTRETTGLEVVRALSTQIKGKTVLITGPSSGTIGGQTALDLAAGSPANIILAGRNIANVQPVIDTIKKEHSGLKVHFVQVDLADNTSVRKAAEEVSEILRADGKELDVLVNNAGIMAVSEYTKSVDGIELQFAANHIGHFLLTNILLPSIVKAKGRIVNVSSFGYMNGGVRFDDYDFSDGKTYNPWLAYSQAKTSNILFAKILAAKLKAKDVLAFSLNPGLILESKLQANVSPELFAQGIALAHEVLADTPMPEGAMAPKTLAQSSATSLYAAFAPELKEHSGAFLTDASVWKDPLREHATKMEDAEKLWELSEKLVGQKFEV